MHGELEILGQKEPTKYIVRPGEFLVLGRSHSADIILANDPSISRFHCKIFYSEKQFFLQNLKENNKTLCDNKPIRGEILLKSGNIIQTGYYKIRFAIVDTEEAFVISEPFAAVKRQDKLFGKIVVKLGLLSIEKLKSAVKKQTEIASDGPYYELEDILVSEKYIAEADVSKVHAYRKKIPYQIPGYKLQELIAMGGMGHIYTATCMKTKKIVACKIFTTTSKAYESQLKELFYREAEALLEFHHPNIVSGIESGENNGISYIIMEYVDGPTLQQHLQDKGGRLLADDALRIIIQISQALSHAQEKGRVHRDIKPENILLNKDQVAKLCDFGLVRQTNSGETEESIFGTVSYMSPEHIRGANNIDIRSDIYSLGAVFYRLLFGRLPFIGDNKRVRQQHLEEPVQFPVEQKHRYKHDLIYIIKKMMAKLPEERYQTPEALLDDLQKIQRKLVQLDDLQATEELPHSGEYTPRENDVALFDEPSLAIMGESSIKIIDEEVPTTVQNNISLTENISTNFAASGSPKKLSITEKIIIPHHKFLSGKGKIGTTAEMKNPIRRNPLTQELPHLAIKQKFVSTQELNQPSAKETDTEERSFARQILHSKNTCFQLRWLCITTMGLVILTGIVYVLWWHSQVEIRDWNKFCRVLERENSIAIQKQANLFLERYPYSFRADEVRKAWQKYLLDAAHNTKGDNRIQHAIPLCNQIQEISPNSDIAKEAKQWLDSLLKEEQQRQEFIQLQEKLQTFAEQVELDYLDQAQKTWNEYHTKWNASSLKEKAIESYSLLQEKLLCKRVSICKYYTNKEWIQSSTHTTMATDNSNALPSLHPSKISRAFVLGKRSVVISTKIPGYFFVTVGQNFHCLALADGRILWSESLPDAQKYAWILLTSDGIETDNSAYASKLVLYSATSTKAKLIDIATGKTSIALQFPHIPASNICFQKGNILVACQDCWTYKISLKSKTTTLGAWKTPNVVHKISITRDGKIYLCTVEGAYQFDDENEKLEAYLPLSGTSLTGIFYIDNTPCTIIQNGEQTIFQSYIIQKSSADSFSTYTSIPQSSWTQATLQITNMENKKICVSLPDSLLFIGLDGVQKLNLSKTKSSVVQYIPQVNEIWHFSEEEIELMNYMAISMKQTSFHPMSFGKTKFMGTWQNQGQIVGDYLGQTSIQNGEVWLHVFGITKRQFIWQRRIGIPICSILPLEKEKNLWISSQDGGIIQVIPNSKYPEPGFKVVNSNAYENDPCSLYYMGPNKILWWKHKNMNGSRLFTTAGEFVKDWKLQEDIHDVLWCKQLQGKFLLLIKDKVIQSFSLVSGRKTSELNHTASFVAPPVISNNTLLASDNNHTLQTWNATISSSNIVWQNSWSFSTPFPLTQSPIPGTKYIYCYDDGGGLYALSNKNGQKIWDFSTKCPITGVTLVEPYIYLQDFEAKIYCLDAYTGKIKWKKETPFCSSHPILVGKKYSFWADASGNVMCVSKDNGTLISQTNIPNMVAWGMYQGNIYVITSTGWLYTIRE